MQSSCNFNRSLNVCSYLQHNIIITSESCCSLASSCFFCSSPCFSSMASSWFFCSSPCCCSLANWSLCCCSCFSVGSWKWFQHLCLFNHPLLRALCDAKLLMDTSSMEYGVASRSFQEFHVSELSAFYTLLLRKRVAMPHMVQVGYTTRRRSLRYTQPRACGPRVCISRRDLHLIV